jgi:hypothetical protein
MYGIVNQAIQELVTNNYGTEKWQQVLAKSGVKEDFFLSNEPYDDSITYQLAGAASEVLQLPLQSVLHAFGEFWVMNTGHKKYGALMSAGGTNLKEFIENLPVFHNRVSLVYPNLRPPEFKVSDIKDNSIQLHYFSHRQGLTEFVRGLLIGLSKLFKTETQIELLNCRDNGHDHDVFKISW